MLARKYKIHLVYNPKLTLEEFIKACDVLYSWDTTAVLWVLLYKKPLIYSTPWWGEGFTPINKYRVGWVPNNTDEFIKYLKLFVNDPNRAKELLLNQKKFFKTTMGTIDGSSSQKHIHLIKSLLEKTI